MLKDVIKKIKIQHPELDDPGVNIIYVVDSCHSHFYYGSDSALLADYGEHRSVAVHMTRSLLDRNQYLVEIILMQEIL